MKNGLTRKYARPKVIEIHIRLTFGHYRGYNIWRTKDGVADTVPYYVPLKYSGYLDTLRSMGYELEHAGRLRWRATLKEGNRD